MKSPALTAPNLVLLETLEDRIAPATLVVGGAGEADHNYDDSAIFTQMAAAAESEGTDRAIGEFFDAAEDMYFVSLNKGDKVLFNNGAADVKWVELTAGSAKLFFNDRNDDGQVQQNELTGMSVGGAAKFSVYGGIDGDIVGNLKGGVFMVGADSHSLALQPDSSIASALITGAVTGSIFVGGKVDKVTVGGWIHGITTGDAVNPAEPAEDGDLPEANYQISLSGLIPGEGEAGTGFFATFTPAAKAAGGNISNVTVSGIETIHAGGGGAGAVGGSISKITISADLGGVSIVAGDGGNGLAGTNAGAGGKVSGVTYQSSAVADAPGMMTIVGGTGGLAQVLEGAKPKQGNGGAGGSVESLSINALAKAPNTPSASIGNDYVYIQGGVGGEGKTGGAGGKVSGIAAYTGDSDIEIRGGNGGQNAGLFGAGGAGGSVTNVHAGSIGAPEFDGEVIVMGGEGGNVSDTAKSSGGKGGDVSGLAVVANYITVEGGEGASGKTGGQGGAISKVSGLTYSPMQSVFLRAGEGGHGNGGAGGHGGNASDINFVNSYGENLSSTAGVTYLGSKFRGDAVISKPTSGQNLVIDGTSAFPANVTVTTYVPGNLLVAGTINGDLIVEGDVWGRMIFETDTSIRGNLLVEGAAGGIFLRQSDGSLSALSEEALADYVTGSVTLSEKVVTRDIAYAELGLFTAHVEGGVSGEGTTTGGNGGSVSKVYLSNLAALLVEAPEEADRVGLDVAAGQGGYGGTKGGTGGGVSNVQAYMLSGNSFYNVNFDGGDGGRAGSDDDEIKGDAGAGGNVDGLKLSLLDYSSEENVVRILGGTGGESRFEGKGGAGGHIKNTDVFANDAEVRVIGGEGGRGDKGSGTGGSLTQLALRGYFNDFKVSAGSAQESNSSVAVAGGSIKGVQVAAYDGNEYNFSAGDGRHGGAGGNVEGLSHTYFDYGVSDEGYFLRPGDYSLSATAGNGSTGGGKSGIGGAIKSVNLLAVESLDPIVRISLAAGNGAMAPSKPSAGGGVENVTIIDSASVLVFDLTPPKKLTLSLPSELSLGSVQINTGMGGSAFDSGVGGKGGDAKNVKWDIAGQANILNLGEGGGGSSPGDNGKDIKVNGTWTSSVVL